VPAPSLDPQSPPDLKLMRRSLLVFRSLITRVNRRVLREAKLSSGALRGIAKLGLVPRLCGVHIFGRDMSVGMNMSIGLNLNMRGSF
jgi:hypothetical protein